MIESFTSCLTSNIKKSKSDLFIKLKVSSATDHLHCRAWYQPPNDSSCPTKSDGHYTQNKKIEPASFPQQKGMENWNTQSFCPKDLLHFTIFENGSTNITDLKIIWNVQADFREFRKPVGKETGGQYEVRDKEMKTRIKRDWRGRGNSR